MLPGRNSVGFPDADASPIVTDRFPHSVSLPMTSSTPGDVTRLLNAVNDGEEEASDALIRAVYEDLRGVAAAHMHRENAGHTLQPTALVHEAYLRLVDQRRVKWQSRSHFFGIAAQAMRRVLIDHARKKKALRRGGGNQVTLLDQHALTVSDPVNMMALDAALTRLGEINERQAKTVELRYFGGLGVKETAEVLNVSEITVKRDWRYAKAWLYREMESGNSDDP